MAGPAWSKRLARLRPRDNSRAGAGRKRSIGVERQPVLAGGGLNRYTGDSKINGVAEPRMLHQAIAR